jgi:hypothetical protein
MKWLEVEEHDQAIFEDDFGGNLIEQIETCVDTRSLHVLIEIARERLEEVKRLNEFIDNL